MKPRRVGAIRCFLWLDLLSQQNAIDPKRVNLDEKTVVNVLLH
jgi:hypothetical protein